MGERTAFWATRLRLIPCDASPHWPPVPCGGVPFGRHPSCPAGETDACPSGVLLATPPQGATDPDAPRPAAPPPRDPGW